MYDGDYQDALAVIRDWLGTIENLQVVGRNGMHMYNNQDHAMMTAMLTAENIAAGERTFDVWKVNQDAEYHEAGKAGAETIGLRDVPKRASSTSPAA